MIIPLLFIVTLVSLLSFLSICSPMRKHPSKEEIKFAERNQKLFLEGFPILSWATVITFISFAVFILVGLSGSNLDKVMNKDIQFIKVIIIFIPMIIVLLLTSLNSYSNASNELKRNKPFLIVSVLLMSIFNSLSMSLMIGFIISK